VLLEIDHHSGVPIYRQIIEQVEQQIVAGLLAGGEQLVSVRDMAKQIRVNPMTVSKAYSLLEMEGYIERQRGVGVFVAKLRKDRRDAAKRHIIEGILKEAAVKAVQLEIDEQELRDLLAEQYERFYSRSEKRDVK